MLRLLFLLALVGIVIPSPPLAAQVRVAGADLAGTTSNQAGAVLAGCTISVTNAETGVTRTVVTDVAGRYYTPALSPSTYTITAVCSGFKTQTRDGVALFLGQAIIVDFTLILATSLEPVTVTANSVQLSPRRTEVSTIINQQQIDALPIEGRNFIGFSLLAPGVSTDRTPLQGAASTSGLSFTGQRGRSNNVMVDGLDNNDPVVGAVRATLSQDAVREFQVLVNSYSAEFGKASGGVINIVTKGGTNTLHGGAFLYFRDDALNSKKYFDKFDVFGNPITSEKPPFAQRHWGGTLGGPLQKGRTFFFSSLERSDIKDSRFVTIDAAAVDALNRAGFPVERGNVPLTISNTELLGKIDHHWSSMRSLALRGHYADVDREGIDDFGGIVAKSRGTVQLRTDWAVSAAETDVVSSRWLNELRGQYADENQHVNALDPLCGGACTEVDQGGPSLEVTGVAAVGRQRITPQLRLIRRVQVADTVSYFAGAQQIKFGGEYNHLHFPSDGNMLPGNVGGRYFFSPIPPLGVISALDGLEKGIPAAYAQGYGNPNFPEESYDDLSLFLQDELRFRRMVFRPGVRYQTQFWQSATYRASDVGGSSISFPLRSDRNNIAPRFGVSYDLSGRSRAIAHASYGTFYDNIVMAVENAGRVLTGAADGLRTLALPAPLASIAWNAPGHRLSEVEASALLGGSYVSAVLMADPRLKNPFTHQTSTGADFAIGPTVTASANFMYVRGFNQTGTLDYNPVLPTRLGPGRRPNDIACPVTPAAPCINGGIPGSSTSVIQFTSFGESWYKGLAIVVAKRLAQDSQFQVSYTLSSAQDTSTDYQSSFIAQNNGYGRNPDDRFGLPLGFDPRSERGPASHDQRHRLVVSGFYKLPWQMQISGILVAASGRPFTPLAGADLNGDGNGGQFPPDRARRNPADESTSVGRNSGTTAAQANLDVRVSKKFKVGARGSVEALIEAFNVFNRVNFIEDTNQSSFVIFGTGAFPDNPLPAYGRYTLTLPPRQVQLAVRMTF